MSGEVRYGCTVYFERGKVAEISSAHQEWTDALRRIIDSQPALLETLEALMGAIASVSATDHRRGEALTQSAHQARAAIRAAKGKTA